MGRMWEGQAPSPRARTGKVMAEEAGTFGEKILREKKVVRWNVTWLEVESETSWVQILSVPQFPLGVTVRLTSQNGCEHLRCWMQRQQFYYLVFNVHNSSRV